MAINYQRLLMEMNHSGQRQRRRGWVSWLLPAFFLLLAGGGYFAWRENLGERAGRAGLDVYNRLFPSRVLESGSRPGVQGSPAAGKAAAASALFESSAEGGNWPSPLPVIEVAANRDRPAPPPGLAAGEAAPPPPAPVFSTYQEEMRAIDDFLARDPAAARERLETVLRGILSGDDEAGAIYRLGIALRLLREEAKAEEAWRKTAEKWPASLGGRMSALALAETWNQLYAGDRPQTVRWDEIQLMYSRVIGEDDAPFLSPEARTAIKAKLNRLNDALFFGSAPTKLARYHKVEAGELLGGIANRYRADYESIARLNGIHPNRIRAGMDLKVVVGEVSILVRKNAGFPDRTPTLTWFLDGRWLREYPACVGDGDKTPAGLYTLASKERDPSWTNPANGQLLPHRHPENILGSRWMAMKGMNVGGLGIHGTTVDDSVPGYTSAGCIRLHNQAVEELFSYARIGAKVRVVE
jgi:LysM repeat protein